MSVKALRVCGIIEGISTLVLFGIAMPLKYAAGMPTAVSIAGSIHGGLFVLLVLLAFFVTASRAWPWSRAVVIVVAAIVPFGPFVIDGRIKRWGDEAADHGSNEATA